MARTTSVDLTSRRAEMKRVGVDARNAVRQGLDLSDLDSVSTKQEVTQVAQERLTQGSNRLKAANEFGEKMQQELGQICSGIEETLANIGYTVSESYNFQGTEKFWAFLGKFHQGSLEKAKITRNQRLETQNVKGSVMEINNRIVETIKQLGEVEDDAQVDSSEFGEELKRQVARLKEAQPRLKASKAEREELEAQVKLIRLELESGTVTEDERPAKEEEFEGLEKKYHAKQLEETEYLEIVNNAQRSIPEVQKVRTGRDGLVQALRQMRRGLLEKQKNFLPILEKSMTSVRVRSRLDRYQNLDPAFNKTISLIIKHDVMTMGAGVQIALERASKAALDPAESLALAKEMRSYVEEYVKGIEKLEEEANRGVRVPTDPDLEQSDSSLDDMKV